MRLLHVIRTLDPNYGGPVEGLRQIIAIYRARGWSAEVISYDAPGMPWEAALAGSVHALGPGWGRYGFAPRSNARARELMANADVIVVNGVWEYSGLVTLLESGSTPYFIYTHGQLDPWFKRAFPLKHIKKMIYWMLVGRAFLGKASGVLFTTQEESLLAGQSFPFPNTPKYVVGYGTKRPEGDPEHQREAFFQRFPETRGKKNILFLSRIHEKKGCDLLVTAFAKVLGDDPSFHLIMAGPDSSGLMNALKAQAESLGIAERITWTGMLAGEMKWGAFRTADAFALPSHSENFGIVVAEALACGLPVLISNKVNIWRPIEQAGAGLVENDDEAGACNLLDGWLRLPAEEKALMRESALSCFSQNFDIELSADTIDNLFVSLGREEH